MDTFPAVPPSTGLGESPQNSRKDKIELASISKETDERKKTDK